MAFEDCLKSCWMAFKEVYCAAHSSLRGDIRMGVDWIEKPFYLNNDNHTKKYYLALKHL